MSFPRMINFMITGKCNNNCEYCYASPCSSDLSFKNLKKAFTILKNNGVKEIILCGGEPTLRRDFKKIVKELKKQKFTIFLDTDGDFFSKHKRIITENITILSFPIDFPNKSFRNKKNLSHVIKALEFYKKNKHTLVICISTVVTKKNCSQLKEIGELLKKYPINFWKLYQFTPYGGNAKKNRNKLEITQKQFDKVTKNLNHIFSKNFKVIISPQQERNNSYFLIKPNGVIFTPMRKHGIFNEMQIGNIFDKDIKQKWDNAKVSGTYTKKIRILSAKEVRRNSTHD